MSRDTTISRIETFEFTVPLQDMGTDYNGFNFVYTPGETLKLKRHAIRITTQGGLRGECIAGTASAFAQIAGFSHYLLGKDALQREKIYNDLKRSLRQSDRTGIGPTDIALWDIAGKHYDSPIYELLGGCNKPLPAYASTYHGDRNGGLDSPQAFADFAVQCKEMGYPAFKAHPWGDPITKQEIENVLVIRKAVGNDMDLMLDPACEYETFGQALQVGRALDEANYFWYEDPYKDGGVSAFAHRKLRESIQTPLLITEHIRGLEEHVDVIVNDGTDFVRVDAYLDGGITGALKIAHAAEGFGLDGEIHGPGPAHRHLMASIRNTNYYEMGLVHPKARAHTGDIYLNYSDNLDSVDAKGCVYPPKGPGLGAQIDWNFIKNYQTDSAVFE